MFYLTIIDCLNWMNSFFLFTILSFLFYWYFKAQFVQKEKLISKPYFWINFGVTFLCLLFLIWAWVTLYFLEPIYHLKLEETESVLYIAAFCLTSLILNLLFLIYFWIFNLNFILIVESGETLKLGSWKVQINDLSNENEKIYYKKKVIIRLKEPRFKNKIIELKARTTKSQSLS